MIKAYFNRALALGLISGAYQYDTGQRLRLCGLPTPDELAEMDEMLSGDEVTVAVHYSRRGEPQAMSVIALYDDERGEWEAGIPDEYLTRHVAVDVHVYVYYGSSGGQQRGKTMYKGVLTPAQRPAPMDTVTDDQIEQWADVKLEVQLALTSTEAATEKAVNAAPEAEEAAAMAATAAENANTAARTAQTAKTDLDNYIGRFAGLTILVVDLPAESEATATRVGETITLGAPRGADGRKGDPGVDGPTDYAYNMSGGELTIAPL